MHKSSIFVTIHFDSVMHSMLFKSMRKPIKTTTSKRMQTNNSVRDEKQAVLSLQAKQPSFASPLHISRFQTFTKKKLQQKAFAHHRARKTAISKLQKGKATRIQLNEKMLVKVCHFLFRFHFLHCFT